MLLAGYAAFVFWLTWQFSPHQRATKTSFLVAERSLGLWASAFSIAATWIWAPALFIAAREAYVRGVAGLFWFTAPNVACLIIFAFFAERIRAKMPEGFTLSGFIRQRFSRRVQVLYWIELVGLAACSFAVQLLAGGQVVTMLTGLPFATVTLLLALIALGYSLFSGLAASVITDYAQMALILIVGATLIPWTVVQAGGFEAITGGLGGVSGEYGSLWNAKGVQTAWAFGIPVTIGLLAGPFGDQSFWQRAFATRREHVRGAFIRGALVFAVVPLLLSILGFVAAPQSWSVPNPEMVGLETVLRLLPACTVIPFTYMLISGLASTLDSNLCAMSSLAGHDFVANQSDPARIVRFSRWSMLVLAAAALIIANIPGIKILYLFLFYGTLRACTLLPTILSLSTARVRERGMFWGILIAFGVGLPIFTYGNFLHFPLITVTGSLLTVGLSGGIVWFASR